MIIVNIFLSPFVVIASALIVTGLIRRKAKADTFNLEITRQSYSFRYLRQGETIQSDGGDSQQLDIVLGDRHRPYHSSELGCVLVDRAAKQYTSHAFGQNLSVNEQDWLMYEISSFLTVIQKG